MNDHEWLRTGIAAVTTLLGSTVVNSLIKWRRFGPITKAKAAKIAQEAKSAEVDDQSQVNREMREELRRLADRVTALERRNEALEARNSKLREALLRVSVWVQRVWVVLTPEQRTAVGPPPESDFGI